MTDSKTTTFLMITTDKTHIKRYGENPLNDREAPKTVDKKSISRDVMQTQYWSCSYKFELLQSFLPQKSAVLTNKVMKLFLLI